MQMRAFWLRVWQDCDNGFSVDFVQSVVDYLHDYNEGRFLYWKGDDGGVTGRMGYWESSFRLVNGYDEDMKGNGSEDIDLKYRFQQHPALSVERALVFKEECWRRFSAGWSVCNDIGGDEVKGLAEAKMVNVDPEISQGRGWGKHNGANWKLVEKKECLVRNPQKGFDSLGMPFTLRNWADLSDVVLRSANARQLSWGETAHPLPLNEEKYVGLANATAEISISFVSFGMHLAELLWGKSSDVEKLKQLAVGHTNRISLAIAMMRERGIIKKDALVVAMKVETFGEYKLKEGGRQHTGMHAECIGEMVRILFREPHVLPVWMKKVSDACTHNSDVVLLCWDGKQGRRATSMAIAMQHLLEALPVKARIEDINHVARPMWIDRMCGPCAECTTQNIKRSAYLHALRKIWQVVDVK